jgi:hypothetical protein
MLDMAIEVLKILGDGPLNRQNEIIYKRKENALHKMERIKEPERYSLALKQFNFNGYKTKYINEVNIGMVQRND